MSRSAVILAVIDDAFRDSWDVRENRPTRHGFEIAIGWPHGEPRGRGGRGPGVIITAPLVAHLEAFRAAGGKRGGGTLDLPIGQSTIKRIRRTLGHDYYLDQAAWWEARTDELAEMTIEAFAAAYGVSVGIVTHARHALFGPTLRPAGWWREPAAATALLSSRPSAATAADLGLSAGAVRRLRACLRASGYG